MPVDNRMYFASHQKAPPSGHKIFPRSLRFGPFAVVHYGFMDRALIREKLLW